MAPLVLVLGDCNLGGPVKESQCGLSNFWIADSGCNVVVGVSVWSILTITNGINESLPQCKVLQVPLLSYLNIMINSFTTQLCHRGTLPSSSTSNMFIKIMWSDSITFRFLYQAAKLYLNAYRCVFGMSSEIAGVWLLLKCDNDYYYSCGMNKECWLEVETWGSRKGIMLSA